MMISRVAVAAGANVVVVVVAVVMAVISRMIKTKIKMGMLPKGAIQMLMPLAKLLLTTTQLMAKKRNKSRVEDGARKPMLMRQQAKIRTL